MSAHRCGRWSVLAAASVAALLTALVVAGAPAGAASARDTMTVNGYDYQSERPADVIAGSSANNIVFRYVAATALTDGTIVLDVPTADWSTPLQPRFSFTGDPSEDGGVVVRPAPPFTPGPGDCIGSTSSPITWSVVNASDVHRIVVQHLTCLAGQQIAVRIYGVAAPSTTGKYTFPATVSDAAGNHRVTVAKLAVVAPPRIRLDITVPAAPQAGVATPVLVRALKPNGRVDTSYRGGVALLSQQAHDCAFEGYEDTVYDFTAADAGVHLFTVTFVIGTSHQLEAYDVAHQAVAGESGRYQVVGDAGLVDCPVSFH